MSFIIKSGTSEFEFRANGRDDCMLWSSSPFMQQGRDLGYLLLEPGKLSLVHGFEKDSSWQRTHVKLEAYAEIFLNKLEEDSDLLKYDYFYSFSAEKTKGKRQSPRGGGQAGFKVGGYFGSIDASSKPFLTLSLSESAPSGRGRTVQVIDMRNMKDYDTDELGKLKKHRRKGNFQITDGVSALLDFLAKNKQELVTIIPTWQQK